MAANEIYLPGKTRQAGASRKDWKQSKWLKILIHILPQLIVFAVVAGAWELVITLVGTPAYLMPKPSDIFMAAQNNWSSLIASAATTVLESVLGFLISVVLGISLAVLLSLNRIVERSVYIYAIVLQTIPVVAIAPIIVIWFGAGFNAIVMIAFVISFFPILSNTLIGLNATETNMKNLFYLYNASRLQTIFMLRIPAALPYILAGLKISCSLAVVGAIVGEYIAGIGGGKGGLGYSIAVAATRLQTPFLFACGLSASLLGILFYLLVNRVSKRLLSSWHESDMK